MRIESEGAEQKADVIWDIDRCPNPKCGFTGNAGRPSCRVCRCGMDQTFPHESQSPAPA